MAQIITFTPLKVSTSEVSGDGTTSEQLVETINGTFNSLTKDYQYTILGMPSTLLPSSGIITNSVVYCTDLRKFKKFNGTSWIDEIVDIQIATEVQNGIAKLYNSTGQNVDGGITQRLFTNKTQEINTKVDEIDTRLIDLSMFVGYPTTPSGVLGLYADFENKVFTRFGDAGGKTAGADFDGYRAYQRRRCNLADNGTVNAYYGDEGYIEDGSNGQVMVEQNKFYYKVVPLKLEKQLDGIGYHLRKALYMISDNYAEGFKPHPRFVLPNGREIDKVYLSAFEGSGYDVSALQYILDDSQILDFNTDKFCSIANAKPASGLTQNLTKANIQKLCTNRGNGWMSDDIKTESMNQLLMIIELGTFNTQEAIGRGVCDLPSDTGNESVLTGQTSSLGNSTGMASGINGKVSVTYRGYENPWGNMLKAVNGINIYGNGSQKGGMPYICTDFNYQEIVNSENYVNAGFTISNANGYISAFGYSPRCDWIFMPSESLGNSSLPVGDYAAVNSSLNGFRAALVGGDWGGGSGAGGFYWYLIYGSGYRDRNIGGRSLYISLS